MADLRRIRINLISVLGLAALVALVVIAPETRQLAGSAWDHFASFKDSLKRPKEEPTPEEPTPAAEPSPQAANEEQTPAEATPAPPPAPPPHVVTGTDGQYHPEPGYSWVNDDPANLDVRWYPGARHPDQPHVLASQAEGLWHPAPGYAWLVLPGAGDEKGSEDLRVFWQPGSVHPDQPHVIAAKEEEQWTPANGYTWVDPGNPNDLRVFPVEATPNP